MPKFGFKGKKAKLDIEAPDADINLPSADGKIKLEGPDLSLPNVEFKTDIKNPSISGEINADGNLPDSNIDIESPENKSDINFKMPKIKMPEFDINFGNRGDIDAKLPKAEIDISASGSGPEIDMKSVGDINVPSADSNIKLSGSTDVPDVDFKIGSPEFDIKGPELLMPKFKLPKFGFNKKVKMETELPSIEASLPEIDINLEAPEIPTVDTNIDLNLPSSAISGGIDVEAPGIDFKTNTIDTSSSLDVSLPKFKLPKFGFKGPKVNIDTPDVEGDINVNAPDFKADVNINKPDIGLEGVDVDIETPSVDVDIKCPDINVDGDTSFDGDGRGSFNMKMPKFKMPKFGFKGKKGKLDIEAPDADINLPSADGKIKLEGPDLSLPNVEFKTDIKNPSISGEINADGNLPDSNIDIESPENKSNINFKMPKIKMPEFDINFGNRGDIDAKLPKAEIDISASGSGPEIDMKSVGDINVPSADSNIKLSGSTDVPDVDFKIGSPEFDIKGPELQMPKFKLPKFGFNKKVKMETELPSIEASLPEIDINLEAPEIPTVDTNIDLNLPSSAISGGIDVEAPGIDFKTNTIDTSSSLDVSLPKFKLPKFGFKGPKVNIDTPDVEGDINVNAPDFKADVNINKPDIGLEGVDVDIETPSVDVDIKCPDINVDGDTSFDGDGRGSFNMKMPKFKMPKFGFKGKKGKLDIEAPDADINLPSADGKIKLEGPDFSLPNVEFKTDIKNPSISGEINADGNLPDLNIDIESPENKSDINFKMPKIKMPEFDINFGNRGDIDAKLPKAEIDISASGSGPEIDMKSVGDINVPSADSNIKLSGSTDVPDVDFKIGSPEFDIKGPELQIPKFKLPKFGFNKKVKMETEIPSIEPSLPEIDINLEAPEIPTVDTNIDLNLPSSAISGGIDVEAPGIDFNTNTIDTSSSLDVSLPKVKLPKFGFKGPKVNIETPDVEGDINVNAPDFKADVNINKPDIGLEGVGVDIEAPSVDVDIKCPDINVDGDTSFDGDGRGSFNMKMPNSKCPNLDLRERKPN